MKISEIVGSYILEGTNQDAESTKYEGSLDLSADSDGILKAVWLIGSNQMLHGEGSIKNEVLIIDFQYLGANDELFNGIVAYKLESENTLHGVWTEEAGDSKYVGVEKAYKVKKQFLD